MALAARFHQVGDPYLVRVAGRGDAGDLRVGAHKYGDGKEGRRRWRNNRVVVVNERVTHVFVPREKKGSAVLAVRGDQPVGRVPAGRVWGRFDLSMHSEQKPVSVVQR